MFARRNQHECVHNESLTSNAESFAHMVSQVAPKAVTPSSARGCKSTEFQDQTGNERNAGVFMAAFCGFSSSSQRKERVWGALAVQKKGRQNRKRFPCFPFSAQRFVRARKSESERTLSISGSETFSSINGST